ncbi:MAG: capsule biosynthesis protein CapB, partial [Polyangiaceae bacterium]|nr:capsule biosynthesis protein CapB [Polyangiaceae bacterium]
MIRLRDPAAAAGRRVREAIEQALDPVEARLRERAVGAVAARVAADLGGDGGSAGLVRPALLAALARCADGAVGEVARLRSAEAALGVAYQSASGAAERRELLARQLRLWADERRAGRGAPIAPWAWARARLDLAGDLAALGRHLDIEAVQERFAEAIADRVDEIEVAYRALARTARDLADAADALGAAEAGVLRLALAHADPAR